METGRPSPGGPFSFPFGNAMKSGCGSIYPKNTTEASDRCFSALWKSMYWNF